MARDRLAALRVSSRPAYDVVESRQQVSADAVR